MSGTKRYPVDEYSPVFNVILGVTEEYGVMSRTTLERKALQAAIDHDDTEILARAIYELTPAIRETDASMDACLAIVERTLEALQRKKWFMKKVYTDYVGEWFDDEYTPMSEITDYLGLTAVGDNWWDGDEVGRAIRDGSMDELLSLDVMVDEGMIAPCFDLGDYFFEENLETLDYQGLITKKKTDWTWEARIEADKKRKNAGKKKAEKNEPERRGCEKHEEPDVGEEHREWAVGQTGQGDREILCLAEGARTPGHRIE